MYHARNVSLTMWHQEKASTATLSVVLDASNTRLALMGPITEVPKKHHILRP